MEAWVFTIIISICIAALLKSLYDFIIFPNPNPKLKPKLKLPPGPTTIPFVGRLLWLLKSFEEIEVILRNLRSKYGSIVTLQIGPRPAIFISDNSIAYQALVQSGAVFADRPEALPISKVLTSNQRNISSAFYGPTWRLLRRNLTAEILHPSRIRGYSQARKWVSEILISRLRARAESGEAVRIVDHFRYAMFCLLVLMCFGDKLEEEQIKEIEKIQRQLLLSFPRFRMLNLWPAVGKVLLRRRWEELYQLRKNHEDILLPYIRARQQLKQEAKSPGSASSSDNYVLSYVDTLLDLHLPEENRKLNEGEMVSLCSEFLDAGTDTTSTALQWIMANLVKHPHIQAKLFEEINGVVAAGKGEVEEEDLHKMPYLKAVILEGLRRHPPAHFVLPHSVSQDITFEGYVIPKNASVNFMIAEMNWNPRIWEDPMDFKPERFLSSSINNNNGEVFDITGSREIKMMPFGAGRRICPGYGLAILHLEYFVANLVWNFQWKGAEGEEVDLSEKQEFTVVMKNPLQVHLSLRM